MCGICGIVGSENQQETSSLIRRMMHAMEHRGRDGSGSLIASAAAIGMQRLSIIDLPHGQQPIWNETSTLAVVFNGEIYNFRELRHRLESSGHTFRTQSDTETIVHAYEAWGKECVRHLRGMFALAVVEMPEGRTGRPRRVFLARDCIGIKPLYYATAEGKFFFASEVRALLASNCISRRLCPAALASYLLFGSSSEPMTLVEGICSLPPGHYGYISCDAPTAPFVPIAYWSVAEIKRKEAAGVRETPAMQVRSALEDAVRCHLQADVPLGIFLSSGVDSTALATLASRECEGIRTFTMAFPEQEFSEAALARETATRIGAEHSELLLSGNEMCSRVDEAIAAFDQPSVDGVNTFFISWVARQAGLKVALSGLGSDELFGGYPTFDSTSRLSRLIFSSSWLPRPLREAGAACLRASSRRFSHPDAIRKLASAFASPEDFPHPFFFTRTLFPPRSVRQLLHADRNNWQLSPWEHWLTSAAQDVAHLDSFAAVSWLEIRSYLVNTLLRDTDAMSMRHSLEVRVPFLDRPLVELALSFPAAVKNPGATRKALLIEALGSMLPREIITQRKRTFTLPWENWLRGPLRGRVETCLTNYDDALSSFMDRQMITNVWKGFLAGHTSWSRPWSLFVLNEWVKRNLDGPANVSSDENTWTPALNGA